METGDGRLNPPGKNICVPFQNIFIDNPTFLWYSNRNMDVLCCGTLRRFFIMSANLRKKDREKHGKY